MAIGFQALYANGGSITGGNNNTAIGESAGYSNDRGNGNIFIGKRAGYYERGGNKLYIGNDFDKTIIFGNLGSGQLLLGKSDPINYNFKGKRTLNVPYRWHYS